MSNPSNSTVETVAPLAHPEGAAEPSSSRDHEVFPRLADIRSELHAFAVEVSHEIESIRSVLSASPMRNNANPPSDPTLSKRSAKVRIQEPRTRSAEEILGERAADAGRTGPLNSPSASSENPLHQASPPEVKEMPASAPTAVANEPSGQDRLSALKKRLAEKLQAEVQSPIGHGNHGGSGTATTTAEGRD